MMGLLAIAAGIIIAYIVWRQSQSRRARPADPIAPKIIVSVETGLGDQVESEPVDVGPVTPAGNGSWIINPKASFTLTICGANRENVERLKRLLEADSSRESPRDLVTLVARSNLRCDEIDKYVQECKPMYLAKIEELKRSSRDWANASERDREDLLAGFQQVAIGSLDVRPYDYVETLLEGEPPDLTLDDALIDRYGFETFRLYLRYAGDLGKVRVVPANHRDRAGFDSLVEVGLAIRGDEIPLEALLQSLKLRDIRELVEHTSPPSFRRKDDGVAFVMNLPDARERLGRAISYRERFRLQALPREYEHIDLAQVSRAWRHAEAVASLLQHTYMMARFEVRDRVNREGFLDGISGWEILTAGESSCAYCNREAARTYANNKRPCIPLHVGCRCSLAPKFRN